LSVWKSGSLGGASLPSAHKEKGAQVFRSKKEGRGRLSTSTKMGLLAKGGGGGGWALDHHGRKTPSARLEEENGRGFNFSKGLDENEPNSFAGGKEGPHKKDGNAS